MIARWRKARINNPLNYTVDFRVVEPNEVKITTHGREYGESVETLIGRVWARYLKDLIVKGPTGNLLVCPIEAFRQNYTVMRTPKPKPTQEATTQ